MNNWRRNGNWLILFAVTLFMTCALPKDVKSQGIGGSMATQQSSEDSKGDKSSKGDPLIGRGIFEDKCQRCHEAHSDDVKIGPGLKGWFKKPPHKTNSGIEHTHTDATLRKQISKGSGLMPPMEGLITEKDLDDLIAFIETL